MLHSRVRMFAFARCCSKTNIPRDGFPVYSSNFNRIEVAAALHQVTLFSAMEVWPRMFHFPVGWHAN
jgi:hypothetical protein